jgi:glycosyltransferase involved in cell wall biosynthesis
VVAGSRNIGITASSGELIAFLDSDDFWFPKKLEIAVEAYLGGAEVTYHKVKLVDINSKVLYPRRFTRSRKVKTPIAEDLLLRGNALINSSVVASAEILKQVGYLDELPQMAGAEDLNLWLRISKETESFVRLPGLLGAYRSHGSSFSNSKEGKEGRSISAIESFLMLYPLVEQKHSGLNHLLNARKFIYEGIFDFARLSLSRAMNRGTLEVRARALFLYIVNYQSLETHPRII